MRRVGYGKKWGGIAAEVAGEELQKNKNDAYVEQRTKNFREKIGKNVDLGFGADADKLKMYRKP